MTPSWWGRVSPIPSRLLEVCCLAMALLIAGLLQPSNAVASQGILTPAEFAFLLDLSSDTVLLEKSADVATSPASMSKMMTVLMVFERLKAKTLTMDDTFPVSEKAWRKGGSKMFVKLGSRVRVEDLLRGIIVQSGNDACIVVAEGLAGSEAAFAKEMTVRARELGLKNSTFANSTGWPDPEQVMSARDLALLSKILIEEHAEYYSFFSEKEFTHSEIRQRNRNPLLGNQVGADGLKTGHTEESGFGLAASAKRGDRRLVLVLNGLNSTQQRAQEAERLLEWGFRSFESYSLFDHRQVVDHAPVWLGSDETVPMALAEPLTITLSRADRKNMKVTVNYDAPIPAPVKKGDRLGVLTVTAPSLGTITRPLFANASVEELGPVGRVMSITKHWIGGILQ